MNNHTAFRDLVYEEMAREQARLDKYFTEDLNEEGGDENGEERPF